jgi:putative CocE/NonD family hydrolase
MKGVLPENFPAERLSQPKYKMIVERNVWIVMRDGVRVACDIYRPDSGQKFPALYATTAYQKGIQHLPAVPTFHMVEVNDIAWFVSRGYVYVIQDQRGTGESEGDYGFFTLQEQLDFYDCIEWIAVQDWCTGKVGMIGESLLSWSQWLAAQHQPPHLCTIIPFDGGADLYRDVAYHGGILNIGFPSIWYNWELRGHYHLGHGPLPNQSRFNKNPKHFQYDFAWNVISHPTFDEFWELRRADIKKIKVPVFSIGEWHKSGLHLRGNLRGFEELETPKKLLVCQGEVDGDEMAVFNTPEMRLLMLQWYDHWLKDNDTGLLNDPKVCLYIRGKDEFVFAEDWPLPGTRYEKLYLTEEKSGAVDSLNDGGLSKNPPSEPGSVNYAYPQPNWTNFGGTGSAITKHGFVYPYKENLTFTTPPFEKETEICGHLVLTLYASTKVTFPDEFVETKFLCRLWDQFPDETQKPDLPLKGRLLTQGRLRSCYAFDKDEELTKPYRPYYTHKTPRPLEEGKIYKYEFELLGASNYFHKGHRLRMEISNYDSNALDHGGHYYGLSWGEDTLYFGGEHASFLTLPITYEEE